MSETLKTIKKFFIKKYFNFFLFLQLILVLSSFLEVIGLGLVPIFVSLIVDIDIAKKFIPNSIFNYLFSEKSQIDIILLASLILFSAFLFKNLFLMIVEFIQGKILRLIRIDVTTKIYKYYLNKDYNFFLRSSKPEILRTLTSDVSKSISFYTELIRFLKEFIFGLVLFFLIFFVDALVATIICLSLISFLIIFFGLVQKKLKDLGNAVNNLLGQQYKIINESIDAIKEIFLSTKQDNVKKIFDQKVEEVENNFFLTNFLQSIPKLILETLAISSILVISLFFTFKNLDINLIIPILSLVGVATIRLLPTFNTLSRSISLLIYLFPSFKNISNKLEIINKKKSKENNKLNQKFSNVIFKFDNIRFNNVEFKYDNVENLILKKINFKIEKGDKFGIFGPSGSGKSTILDLLSGLIKPSKGEILINEINLNKINELWRGKIGYAPQFNCFLNESLKKNISFFDNENEINDTKILEIIKKVELNSLIEESNDGINTILGERGIRVSGGERQRICLARSIYRNPEILILDETTNSLDHKVEKEILDSIYKNLNLETIILISHKIETFKFCNKILILEKGEVKDILDNFNFFNRYQIK
jgi:ATP-binding cassette, subfamily B, bacterial PglK